MLGESEYSKGCGDCWANRTNSSSSSALGIVIVINNQRLLLVLNISVHRGQVTIHSKMTNLIYLYQHNTTFLGIIVYYVLYYVVYHNHHSQLSVCPVCPGIGIPPLLYLYAEVVGDRGGPFDWD
jgi:hypothetical protein